MWMNTLHSELNITSLKKKGSYLLYFIACLHQLNDTVIPKKHVYNKTAELDYNGTEKVPHSVLQDCFNCKFKNKHLYCEPTCQSSINS